MKVAPSADVFRVTMATYVKQAECFIHSSQMYSSLKQTTKQYDVEQLN